MSVSKEILLSKLPAYKNEWVTVTHTQDVRDIMKDIIKCHKEFRGYYDNICSEFLQPSIEQTCDELFNFCVANIHYREENEDLQTTALPTGILYRGYGDCKHYASFIGGVLGGLQRAGENIDWYYCFASYKVEQRTPYHVFVVVVKEDGSLLYIDPTPGANNKQPIWVVNERVPEKRAKVAGMYVDNIGELGGALYPDIVSSIVSMISGTDAYGALIPAPHWYPAYLPKFYRASGGEIILRPLNAVPKYSENDVLDACLYLQTIIGFNRTDFMNARSAAWKITDGSGSAQMWVTSAFKSDGNGDGSGNFAAIPNNGQSIDESWYRKLQDRYVLNEALTMPWLTAMMGIPYGFDLETIPAATDKEISRPKWYPDYLPSLFTSSGQPFQYPAGHLDTKPKLRKYVATPSDVANLMIYAQPLVYAGPTPYPTLWYINDVVNGAMAMYFKVSLYSKTPHTDSQEQEYGITGDIMKAPVLDADPYASDFTHALVSIVEYVISFFAGKIPGGTKLVSAAYAAGTIKGGELITGGQLPATASDYTIAVFDAANGIVAEQKKKKRRKVICG